MSLMFATVTLEPARHGYCRLAIEVADDGVYLLMSRRAGDGPFEFDHRFETVADAKQAAEDSFGVAPTEWVPVAPGGG